MDLQLKGKVALVTGSTTGIGFVIGSSLAGEGATVIINGRSEKRVGDAIATISQKYPQAKLEACAGDLSTAATAQRVAGEFTHVDILINNLGLYDPKLFEAYFGSGLAGHH
jgi:NAD(P)-dependent dehydrogenase (short-subunit alcohol dehydrogenase family)